MNLTDIISVDPSQKALGTVHTEITEKLLRNTNISHRDDIITSRQFVNFIFGNTYSGNNLFSTCIFLLRTLFSIVLILSGSLILMNEVTAPIAFLTSQTFAIGQIVIGAMLFLGILNRFAMAAGFAGFAFITFKLIMTGMFIISPMVLGLGCLAFMILGSGRFSSDFLIRKAIILHSMRHRKKMAERRLSYRAYRYSSYL